MPVTFKAVRAAVSIEHAPNLLKLKLNTSKTQLRIRTPKRITLAYTKNPSIEPGYATSDATQQNDPPCLKGRLV
jgi:hypothetical protein